MSPIRTRRARAARGGRENLIPAATPGKPGLNAKKYPGTPLSTRTAVPRKTARRNTLFVIERIEQAGKQRHVLADRRAQVNVAQDLKERRKTMQLIPMKPLDDSPESESPASAGSQDSKTGDEEDEEDPKDEGEDEERHVHWTDGIKNRAGSVVLPPRVPTVHFPILRNKARASCPKSILQVSVYRDPLVTPRKPVAASSSHFRGRTSPLSAPVFDFTPPGVELRTQEQSQQSHSRSRSGSSSRSAPLVQDPDLTPTGQFQHPSDVDDTPRCAMNTTQPLLLRRSLSGRVEIEEGSSCGLSQATTYRDLPRTQQLYPTLPTSDSSAHVDCHEVTAISSRRKTVQDTGDEDSSDGDTLDSDSPPRTRPSLFRLPRNRSDRLIIIFSMFYFPLAIYLLLPVVGLA